MKKIRLNSKLLVGLIILGAVFFSGIYGFQRLSEQKLIEAAVVDEFEQVDLQSEMDEMNQMSVREFYTKIMGMSEESIADFEEKYSMDADEKKAMEISGEEHSYLTALRYLSDEENAPILSRNELSMEDKSYLMSLETSLADINALSSKIDSTKPIIEICRKHGIDPDGKISDLTAEAIAEIDQKLFEISDHPKE